MYQSIKKSVCCLTFLLLAFCFQTGNVAAWQDDSFDPFAVDEPDAPVVTPGSDTRSNAQDIDLDKSLSEGVRLVIKAVRGSNPTSPEELGRAIKSMLNLQQYDEARNYLDQLVDSNLAGPQIFELSERLGATFLVDLQTVPELQPEGGTFARRAFEAARKEAYAPSRVAKLINELSDEDKFVRNDAFRKLRLLGAPAVAVMLEVCENENRRKEVPFLQAALRRMGEPALLPLVGAVRADGTIAQAVAVGALSNINHRIAQDALLRTSLSSFVPASVRAIAADAVAQRGLAGQYEITRAIANSANQYLDGQIELPVEQGMATVWHWKFEPGKLIPTQTSAENAMRIMAVDLARDAYRLEPSSNEYRQLQLLTVADAAKRMLGSNRVVQMEEVKGYIPDLNSVDLNQALETANQRNLTPAAVGVSELIGQTGDNGVLLTGSGKNSPLVNAVISGNRELQYAACKAISQIDPRQAFPGCSYVGRITTMMAATDGRSTGIVAHPRSEVAQALASSIFQTGSIGLTASSGEQLFDILNSNPDIEFILVADSLTRQHYQEVVQQLRGYWLSKSMPIALLIRSAERERQAELIFDRDPMTIVLPLTSNPKLVFAQVKRLQELRKNVVSNAQRNQHSHFAMNWLGQLLDDPETYRFYDLSAHRDQLLELVNVPGNDERKSKILARLGTADSQLALADLASTTIGNSKRELFARAFADSIDRFGILLTPSQIRVQYDRYNASEFEPVEVQKILGSMLDAIEARAKANGAPVSFGK